ncbi:Dol-P-Glc:Glc(2)Man(9)GlcNAc(2)-PP-Dol alpha-1,2-glucosyltransferase [Pyrus ussuriensis x Pyrus communis]|uniref:Dol-P-Glc:Glc(2)Man(9)GlcNAc(2)-PP-Dol alpha-1,2-glucosyltransferase n=1 Tax=Pyrus ussuriensis x Pyrus communis TaxID=2448454 RepID=A0A5N5HS40_9ROSA|nr:Dol-P-Glc:Glc(2)Man(9)GlcNAc(2)-PP-Dol alpha-1,2-glucosyltransferase [Pyrus ussuriensis x Pyrus communis]
MEPNRPFGFDSEQQRNMGRIAVAAIVSLWVIPISILVSHIVPEPYMDEIFHVPQAQQYCNGNFRSWDPMITTPPGLYYLSLAHVAYLFPGMSVVKAATSFSECCSTAILRSFNGVLAVFCSIVVYEIIIHLRPALDERKATLYAVLLAIYPLHWFFGFLYYTDVASLAAVLAMHLACLKKKYWFSALLGSVAVVIRQTNIIWMLFVCCSEVINITMADHKDKIYVDDTIRIKGQPTPSNSVTLGSNLRKRKATTVVDTGRHLISTRKVSFQTCKLGFLDEIEAIFPKLWHMKLELLVSFSPFILVLAAFIAFVRWNGSVVLGAKDAHAVSPHFAQIMYFGLFSALAMAPMLFSPSQTVDLFQSMWKNKFLTFIQISLALGAGFIAVHFFSIAHPYLLADNRHYPFYLWRKVIKAHWSMKYLLVPLYVYSWLSIVTRLGKFQRKIWVLAFFLATAAVLVPAPLIEFRYYTIPFFFLILHSHTDDYRTWLIMGVLYITVNVFTMMMFLYRPFHWSHEPGAQRFIW